MEVRHYSEQEAYFNGRHRLAALGVSLPPEMRLLEMVVDWPRITVESMAERLVVEGFSMRGQSETDNVYQDRWQANRLDTISRLVHTEALVHGLAYVTIGVPGAGERFARITAATAQSVRATIDSRTGLVSEAIRYFDAADGTKACMHYTPSTIAEYHKTGTGWAMTEQWDNPANPFVPVVPFINRARISDWRGRSEMRDVMRYTDACSRSLTNLQVATELVALPQRYMLGATPDSFKDSAGRRLTKWEVYIGRFLTGPKDGKIGQLAGADLTQIESVVRLYAGLVSASTGMALTSLGVSSEANPASAEALNAADNRHVKKAESKQILFGESWEMV